MKLQRDVRARLIFRLCEGAVAIAALVFSFLGAKPIALYYTNWSVWFATATSLVALCAAFAEWKGDSRLADNEVFKAAKFASEIMIIATFIVSAFVLPNKIWTAAYWTSAGSVFKHFLLPLAVVADGVLCDKNSSYKTYFPFTALIAPFLYWLVLIVRFCAHRASCGGAIPQAEWNDYYPYGFTNIDNGHSLGGLIGLIAGIVVGLIAVGFGLYFLNRRIGKKVD